VSGDQCLYIENGPDYLNEAVQEVQNYGEYVMPRPDYIRELDDFDPETMQPNFIANINTDPSGIQYINVRVGR
jgi:hypothetical protein